MFIFYREGGGSFRSWKKVQEVFLKSKLLFIISIYILDQNRQKSKLPPTPSNLDIIRQIFVRLDPINKYFQYLKL